MSESDLYRVGFVGDVHGSADELESIIEDMEKHGVDQIISLGDLFDRGPDAPRCLRIIKDRGFIKRDGSQGKLEMVLGNHEDRNLRVWRKLPIPGRDRPPTAWTPKEYKAITEEEWRWLNDQPFYLRIKTNGLDLCAVHGGFTEGMKAPGWHGFDMGGVMARVGFLRNDGTSMAPGSYGTRLWADEYDGRFGRCFYGHTTFDEPRFSDHAVGLDGTKRGKVFGIVVSNAKDEVDLVFERKIKSWTYLAPKPFKGSTGGQGSFSWDSKEWDGSRFSSGSLADSLETDWDDGSWGDGVGEYEDVGGYNEDPWEIVEELTERQYDANYNEIISLVQTGSVQDMRDLVKKIKEKR